MFTLAKISAITPFTMTCDSGMLVLALATLGGATKIGSNLFLCHASQGGQGKYSSDCRASLSLTVSLTNFTNVNSPVRQ
jgi:hypothetical protein